MYDKPLGKRLSIDQAKKLIGWAGELKGELFILENVKTKMFYAYEKVDEMISRTEIVKAFAAFSLRRGIAATSIRYLKSETEYWIEQERKAGIDDWSLVEVVIMLEDST